MGRHCTTTRAFTTVELLVVALILILLATISLTSLSGRGQLDPKSSEARKISHLLGTARSYALAENGYFRVVIWLDQPSYWIDEVDSSGNVIKPKIITPEPLDENVVIPEVLVDSVVRTGGEVAIRFTPQGSSSEASIYLIRRGADQTDPALYHTVRLYGPTGRANILKNQRP